MRSAQPSVFCVVWLAVVIINSAATAYADEVAEAERTWGEEIRAFEAADRRSAPPLDGVLFVGSSSIRLWKLEESFPDVPVINRGFGGSQMSDALHLAGRIVLPYKPRLVVVYAGDNDIAEGESPEQVTRDFRALVEKIHDALPRTRIAYISIKPSVARWNLYDNMKAANERIRALCERDQRLSFIDVATPMLDNNGRPRENLFAEDGLHLSDAGYQLWTELVGPQLQAIPPREPE